MSTTRTASATAVTGKTAQPVLTTRLFRGILGGLAGGMVFGMMMQMMGAIPTIAKLVGSDSVAVGWLVHLAISAVLGFGFGLVVGTRLTSIRVSLGLGAVYGMVWWVLGALIAMPLALGMPVFALTTMAWMSLMGHMVYGAVLGLVAYLLGHRRS
jgi:uncharacterized membrane protein YagU involved in acid resistance